MQSITITVTISFIIVTNNAGDSKVVVEVEVSSYDAMLNVTTRRECET